jgi:hypothetical protein
MTAPMFEDAFKRAGGPSKAEATFYVAIQRFKKEGGARAKADALLDKAFGAKSHGVEPMAAKPMPAPPKKATKKQTPKEQAQEDLRAAMAVSASAAKKALLDEIMMENKKPVSSLVWFKIDAAQARHFKQAHDAARIMGNWSRVAVLLGMVKKSVANPDPYKTIGEQVSDRVARELWQGTLKQIAA